MIHVERKTPAPEILASDDTRERLHRAAEHFAQDDARSEQFEFDFGKKPPFKDPSVRSALYEVFAKRCAFCETEVGPGSIGVVHHFRPTQEAIGLDGRPSRPHYWWLAYAWENLYLSCARCASGARRRFPVSGERAPEPHGADHEEALLVDPCRDEPDDHIAFDENGEAAGLTEKGRQTVDVYRLNRTELLDARRREIVMALAALSGRLREGGVVDASLLGIDREYTGAVRQNVLRHLAERGVDAGELRSAAEEAIARRTVKAAVRRQRRRLPMEVGRVESISIRDFRGIRKLDIDFATAAGEGAGGWTMLLGENGRGKSSVLQALALVLAGGDERQRLDLRGEDLVRHGAKRAELTVKLADIDEPRTLVIDSPGMRVAGMDAPVAVAAYGAARVPARSLVVGPAPDPKAPRVHNLFHPGAPLIAATQWLLDADEETFRTNASALRELLYEPEAAFEQGDGAVLLTRRHGPPVPIEHLSDGYRSLIALAVDVMAYFSERFGSLARAEGIVLVDEISVHLHPRWQMRVVKALSRAFPALQFIATTHDPLSLRGMDEGSVVVLGQDPEGEIFRVPDVPKTAGLRVDELLTSPVFGLSSTMDDDTERIFDQYYAQLALPEGDRDEDQIRDLHGKLQKLGQMGRTPREELVLRAADEYYATEGSFPDPLERRARYEETVARLRRLWQGGV
ncbi:MAG TPA: AAA family ATPase [Solirubrobacteraceae bacterium]